MSKKSKQFQFASFLAQVKVTYLTNGLNEVTTIIIVETEMLNNLYQYNFLYEEVMNRKPI